MIVVGSRFSGPAVQWFNDSVNPANPSKNNQ